MNLKRISINKFILIFLLFLCSLLLFIDANTFSLYPADNVTGREYGCYTVIENLIGTKSPSVIRQIELIGAILIFVICLVFTFKMVFRNSLKSHKC